MQRVVTLLEDDLNGEKGEDVRTRKFSVDGIDYEIELSDGHWSDYLDAVSPFTANARRRGVNGLTREKAPRNAEARQRSGDIRAWAHAQGIKVADHGRIAGDVIAKYDAAH